MEIASDSSFSISDCADSLALVHGFNSQRTDFSQVLPDYLESAASDDFTRVVVDSHQKVPYLSVKLRQGTQAESADFRLLHYHPVHDFDVIDCSPSDQPCTSAVLSWMSWRTCSRAVSESGEAPSIRASSTTLSSLFRASPYSSSCLS